MQSKEDMKAFVVNLLNKNLPEHYYYHNQKHTLYVLEKTIEIAVAENCTKEEIDLLSVAALWHDTGFTKTYKGHEEESCKLARQYLPGYGYAAEAINTICEMIMATKIPQSPKNRLDEIVVDADLEYLGTPAAADMANDLFKELQALKPSLTRTAWNQTQISFLQQHHYFTRFCKERKAPGKQLYLDQLLKGNG